MPDGHGLAAVAAGLLCGGGVLLAIADAPSRRLWRLSSSLRLTHSMHDRARGAWSAARMAFERAGWRQPPGRVVAVALAPAMVLSVGLGLIAAVLVPFGFAVGAALFVLALASAIDRRRRRLAGELVPLLELFTLELSSGGGALQALGSVSMQVDGELAGALRLMLIAAQVGGSQSFETRLLGYAERVQLPALSTLATILGANRDFGTGVTQGVRALATDLRRAQRRDLIMQSRRALNHVLLPAAVGVLLPFLGVLMFPAVSVLQHSLR